MQFTIFTLQ